jgi:chloride channel protein, CIC family
VPRSTHAAGKIKERFYSPQPNVPGRGIVASYRLSFWAVAVAVGVIAGLGGAALLELLKGVEHLAWSFEHGTFLGAVKRASAFRIVLVLFLAGVLTGIGALMIRRLPGFGGGEVSEALWLRDGHLSLLQSLSRGVLSIVTVAMGSSLGREAAPQLAGAAAASRLCDAIAVPRWQRRLLVACGAGAGMAAVYNVPLGGALFALEVLLGTITLPLVLPALLTTGVATLVAWIALPNRPVYVIPGYHISAPLVVWAVLVGPLAGLLAVGWVRLIARVHELRPSGWRRAAAPVIVLTALGFVAIKYPYLLGNGQETVQLATVGALSVGLLAALVVLKPLATAACLGSGAPGGLFTPTLTFGVLFGGLVGHAWGGLWPGASPGSYAMIGGAAVLAASMQGPLAAIVLVLELAPRSETLVVPLLLAVAGATIVSRVLGAPSVYSARLGQPSTPADEPDDDGSPLDHPGTDDLAARS